MLALFSRISAKVSIVTSLPSLLVRPDKMLLRMVVVWLVAVVVRVVHRRRRIYIL